MADFVTENDLNAALSEVIENAESYLLLISPYIKLHERYKSILKMKLENPNFEMVVVFGKNEEDISKSMGANDFNFFKQFPNIQIRYEKRLHAKFYANEDYVLITSMNLYNYSQDTNIESGVIAKRSNNIAEQAMYFFDRVIEQSELLYAKEPLFEKRKLLADRYIKSEIKIDKLSDFFNKNNSKELKPKIKRNTKKEINKNNIGYCIRTGVEIPFNIEMPLSTKAFKSWSKYEDENYPEKFCHFSGEPSNGKTSFKNPILRKNWKKAKEKFKF